MRLKTSPGLFLRHIGRLALQVATMLAFAAPAFPAAPSAHRPIGLTATDEHLYVAGNRSGSVVQIALTDHRIMRQKKFGAGLEAMAADTEADHLWLMVRGPDRLLLVRTGSLKTVDEFALRSDTGELAPAGDGRIALALRWSRRVLFFARRKDRIQRIGRIDLPFAPGKMAAGPNGRLYVADAFGGQIASVDPEAGKLLGLFRIDGHNIRGLAVDPQRRALRLTHQQLNSRQSTHRNRVFW
ncbi:MAG: hypothetical protein R3236_11740, partial [Phycisphaeraceae bacterium]|nr:hypothetical protein [Phycisphaeraceae bacterium]